jgi:hypothetical protein
MADIEDFRYPNYPTEEQCKVRRTLQMVFAGSPLPLDPLDPLDTASGKHIELLPCIHLDLRPNDIVLIYRDAFTTSDFYRQFYPAFGNSTVLFFDDDRVSFGFQNLQQLGMRIELYRKNSLVKEIVGHAEFIDLWDGATFRIASQDTSQDTELMCMRYLFQNPSPSA